MPKPFVKWAGGKRQLLTQIAERLPNSYRGYYEPFIGGGAVLFELAPKGAVINDINEQLINTYIQIKDAPEQLMAKLDVIDAGHESAADKKEYYYQLREQFNKALSSRTASVSSAAMFVYLNKHCFNGLYRVNGRGLFNVPFNGSNAASYVRDDILEVSSYLGSVNICCGDFADACIGASEGDFVFFDSPYAPLNPTSFEAYTKEGFGYSEHLRLAELFEELDAKGCLCMLTNHNTKLINELYSNYKIDVVSVRRSINSDASKRTGTEVIITNY